MANFCQHFSYNWVAGQNLQEFLEHGFSPGAIIFSKIVFRQEKIRIRVFRENIQVEFQHFDCQVEFPGGHQLVDQRDQFDKRQLQLPINDN